MTTETKILGSIVIATVILLVGGIFFLSRSASAPAKDITGAIVSQIDYNKGEKLGSDSAKVKVVEFSDFQCPACLAAEPVVKQVRAAYPDQVQFIYRHFPLPQHSYGQQAAVYAEAAGEQGKFWEMHDKLFETQAEWSGLDGKGATAFFLELAKQLSLDENKINQAIVDSVLKARIDEDKAEGNRLGVNSTPTFFVNGRKVNLQSFDNLTTAVAEELKK
ncbi:MAG: thioredoxin domain-containing protein [bacterium]|nr:thioredoxin domain-containing protein [bacterium]